MATGVQPDLVVRLLGPIGADRGGVPVDLGPPAALTVFAVLANRAGRPAGLDELSEAVWGAAAPRSAHGALYGYVSRLRKALEPDRTRSAKPRFLVSGPAGYALVLPPDAADFTRFAGSAARAQRHWAAKEFDEALNSCDEALACWTGPSWGGGVGPFAEAERSRLDQARADVQELRCAALLELGASTQAVPVLTELVAEHPLRERLHELLVLALHGTGRQAEALAAYQAVRTQLVEELGVEPGPALRRAHQLVLAGEDPAPARIVPAQLPRSVTAFTGREEPLRRVLDVNASARDTTPICTIDGPAGIGKTAFALHAAHRVSPDFPDGRLFLDLRGFDPRFPPLSPDEALDRLLRSLGGDPRADHPDLDAKAATYRSLLSGKRVLVVLDNAVSAEQVRPLLPGTPGCLTLVTSRDRLAGLAARDGATRIGLGLLSPEESAALLSGDAEAADPALTAELARLCGHLPLALRIAAERTHAFYGVAELVRDLRCEHARLDTLTAPDDEASMLRAVFSWSYQALKPPEAQAFRLLSTHPGVHFGLSDSAALLGVDVPAARRTLDRLARLHLIEQTAPDRYTFHDLVRLYAGECAQRDESPETRQAATRRLLRWYAAATAAARAVLAPGFGPVDLTAFPAGGPVPAFGGYDQALEWSGREMATLCAALGVAAEAEPAEFTARFATALGALCHCTSSWREWLGVVELGRRAARSSGDRLAGALLENDAGVALHFLGRVDEAIACHDAAARILAGIDRPDDQVVAANLAVARSMSGRHRRNLTALDEALAIARRQGNGFLEASVEDSFGAVLSALGRHGEAVSHGLRSVDLLREVGTSHMLAHGLTQVGFSLLSAGEAESAARHLGEAVDLWRELGDHWGAVHAVPELVRSLRLAGRPDEARSVLSGVIEENPAGSAGLAALLADLS
ncbi:BTAD domain-containing putative transcriptional regulator [Amycolatopsis sp. NPDC004368]